MPAPRSQPTFRGLAPLSAAFAVAAAAALASAPLRAAAYDFGDVCKVVITLKYTAPSVYEQSFSIESNQQSVTQDATASLQIQPGTVWPSSFATSPRPHRGSERWPLRRLVCAPALFSVTAQ